MELRQRRPELAPVHVPGLVKVGAAEHVTKFLLLDGRGGKVGEGWEKDERKRVGGWRRGWVEEEEEEESQNVYQLHD